jgi:peptide/nickel transport system substrate-binding protein
MNKKRMIRWIALACLLLLAAPLTAGCKKKSPVPDVFVIATDTLDGVFNPFFATNAQDVSVAGMTQLSMLVTSKDGEVDYGDGKDCVVKDVYMPDTVDERTEDDRYLASRPNFQPDADYYSRYYSTYSFLLKNGLKFSDGTPLTVKDVLFNYYVYLDVAYTGSSTLYSTNIRGLKAYRAQDTREEEQNGFDSSVESDVNARIQNIKTFMTLTDANEKAAAVSDVNALRGLFREELESDWTAAAGQRDAWPQYFGKDVDIEQWQAFLIMEGYIGLEEKTVAGEKAYVVQWNGWDDPARGHGKDYLVSTIYNEMVWEKETVTAEDFGGAENASVRLRDNVVQIVDRWASGQELRKVLAAQIQEDRYEKAKEANGGVLPVPTVSGITAEKVTSFNGKSLPEPHDAVTVVVNGVDPKAIWNFGVEVAPMHVYSTPALAAAAADGSGVGVDPGSTALMRHIKGVSVPVGAGPYKAKGATADYNEFFSGSEVKFEANENFLLGAPKMKYLSYKVVETNRKFEEVQKGGVHYADPSAKADVINAVTGDKNLSMTEMPNLGYGYIGINAGKVIGLNVRRAFMRAMDLSLIAQYYTGNTAEIIYYPMSKVSWAYPAVNDPKYIAPGDSVAVWTKDNPKYPFVVRGKEATGAEERTLTDLIERDGYIRSDGGKGTYMKTVDGIPQKLAFEFTVAGSSDHPITPVFDRAASILNKIGCDITVRARADALSKLTNGDLAVWAAAWGTTIDPDMFQVYHKDSKATSVKAWGYPYLLEHKNQADFAEENKIIGELSALIEKGREYLKPDDRKPIYKQALDKVLDLAVELPAYQRNNLAVYNNRVVDESTLTPKADCKGYKNPISRIWEVDFVR